MAVTHNWGVNPELKTKAQDGHDNVVFQVNWYLRSEETVGDDTYHAYTGGDVNLNTSDLSDFTAFSDLTETQVLGWAKAQIDADAAEEDSGRQTCAEWQTTMESEIAYKKNPPTRIKPAPWAAN